MADRRRSAAAAATYDHVCHLLAVSARSDCRSLVNQPNSQSNNFSTGTLSFSDEHAVAICAALLVNHSASWPLVRRYVRTYLQHVDSKSLSFFDISAMSPFPAQSPQSLPVAPSPSHAHPSPYTADFSFNSALTSRGAAAILAACLLIPRTLTIEALFNFCPELSFLPMTPWLSMLNLERKRPHRSNLNTLIIGLSLDACPVRAFDPLALSAFPNLHWISLRATRISNLRKLAETFDALPNLVAALISGDAYEQHPLDLTRRYAASICSSNHLDKGELPQPLSQCLQSRLSTLEKAITHRRQRNASDGDRRQLGLSPSITPVTLVPEFRTFLLVASRTYLRLLDGKPVSVGEREHARRTFSQYFDHPATVNSALTSSTTSYLLKSRELGLLSARKLLNPTVLPKERPQKRRRTGSSSHPVTDIMAAVTAAGFTTAGNSSKLSPADSMTVALAATTYAENVKRQLCQNLTQVRVAALNIQKASEHERLSMLASRWQQKPRREPPSEGMTGYRGDAFKQRMLTALINRRGSPRVDYLCHGIDRPRQLEFNPANPSELVYGTEHGYLVVMDEMSGVVKGSCASGGGTGNRLAGDLIRRTSSLEEWSGYRPTTQALYSNDESGAVYGLSWLNTTSNLFISGVNSGAIHVYDVSRMGRGTDGGCRYACETFNRLTSIHASADDVRFAVSGIARDVGIFDLETGKRLETMANCHAESVNVIKFAHHSPHILLTSSFDRCVRKWDLRESRPGGGRRPIFTTVSRTDNVMACFSPDDSYLLVSAVDNEVRQYTACDGRLEREFRIPKRGSPYNYTRSYYMNDRDYIVMGSCQESVVRVYNARTGAFFTEVDMDNRHASSSNQYYVQTLRANPSRSFYFSAILSSPADSANDMIASVDLHSR